MGSGRWSAADYNDRAVARAKAGKDVFDYSGAAHRSGHLRPHQTLDPQGLGLRESRDSAEHPESNAIIISLDVTGSMGKVVRGIHADLPHLHELLLGHRYIPGPQILFAAVGDATCDQVPLQVGQFESDNRMDQNLENMILEGGGGGQKTESYELMLYVAARHTAIDCFEKRGRKGYLFIIGDEMAYPRVKQAEVQQLLGEALAEDIPVDRLIAEVKARYHLYYLLPGGASYGGDEQVRGFWRGHLGAQDVIRLESPEDTSECIALTIGVNEGAITMDEGAAHLRHRGVVGRTIDRLTGALGSLVAAGPTVRPTGARRL
ncbi:MAG TPA: hypothetical protein VGI81_22280 [Tepidisphaeraceae bacterium]|jgi:hypothetical protein